MHRGELVLCFTRLQVLSESTNITFTTRWFIYYINLLPYFNNAFNLKCILCSNRKSAVCWSKDESQLVHLMNRRDRIAQVGIFA